VTEFEKQKREVWAKAERLIGVPIKQNIRQLIENEIAQGDEDDESEYWLLDLENAIFPKLVEIGELVSSSQATAANRPQIESAGNQGKRKYRGPFEKRLYLVDFVARESKSVDLNNITDRSFMPHRRIKWKQVCDEWNKAHPHDPKSVPALKARYYGYIAEADLQRDYFDRIEKEIAEGMAPIAEAAARMAAFMEEQWTGWSGGNLIDPLVNVLRAIEQQKRGHKKRRKGQ